MLGGGLADRRASGHGVGRPRAVAHRAAGAPVHVFEAFALVNFRLCSAVGTPDQEVFRGGQRGRSTRVMREACAEHVRVALTLLQPTVLIAQGRAVRQWLGTVLDEVEPLPGTFALERVRVVDRRALLASFIHPSAPTPDNWGANAAQPYLMNTVVPTVAVIHGRREILSGSWPSGGVLAD